ncbi:ADP ribosylation factor family 50S ribosome binding GTPase putative Ras of Complex Roc domain [Trypanosoma vivax]|uniref:Putative small G-protein n=1 Tax=Trypanosoma vivax (strain Y486) TaxID=1055687 RepID=G0U7D1_TRYVY|nr:putative small G-protein [Trypanosoma vivax]KAH8620532.1 ADP ribosylation factor family 50S ribosome binding GTPase putative Ras of Complex Roc domain [Trypanosoma vivax]CCC51789.1 putative small G-protein [Trypanosoma vivax Y486]
MLDSEKNSIKVIVLGDTNVGKTSMLRRFVKGDFLDEYKSTIGAEFMERSIFIRQLNKTVKLMLWDTAGHSAFNSITRAYYRGAAAAILAFGTDDRKSFENVDAWKQRISESCGSISIVLCQTKFDMAQEAAITGEEAEQLAVRLRLPLFRVSTKDNFNVTELFEYAANMCLCEAADNAPPSGTPPSEPQGKKAPSSPPRGGSQQEGKRVTPKSATQCVPKKKKKKACAII